MAQQQSDIAPLRPFDPRNYAPGDLQTVGEFADENPQIGSRASLRWLRENSDGIEQGVFLRLGSRWFVCVPRFMEWSHARALTDTRTQ